MVIYHSAYVAQGTSMQSSTTFGMASVIADAVLHHFELNNLQQYQTFLAEIDMFERGDEVDIHAFLHALDGG